MVVTIRQHFTAACERAAWSVIRAETEKARQDVPQKGPSLIRRRPLFTCCDVDAGAAIAAAAAAR